MKLKSIIVLYLLIFFISCEAPNIKSNNCELTSFSILKSSNTSLLYDIKADIDNNYIHIKIPYSIDKKALIPTFTHTGYSVFIGQQLQTSSISNVDFSVPQIYTVYAEDSSFKNYLLIAEENEDVNINILPLQDKNIVIEEFDKVLKKTSISVVVKTKSNFDVLSYLWFIDGLPIDGATSDSIELFASDFSEGTYLLTILAQDNSNKFSDSTFITIEN